ASGYGLPPARNFRRRSMHGASSPCRWPGASRIDVAGGEDRGPAVLALRGRLRQLELVNGPAPRRGRARVVLRVGVDGPPVRAAVDGAVHVAGPPVLCGTFPVPRR